MRSSAYIAIPLVLACVSVLSGCQQNYYYERTSGLRVDAKPELLTTFQVAKTECAGEVAQTMLSGGGLRAPSTDAYLTQVAMYGCMSKRGYDVRA